MVIFRLAIVLEILMQLLPASRRCIATKMSPAGTAALEAPRETMAIDQTTSHKGAAETIDLFMTTAATTWTNTDITLPESHHLLNGLVYEANQGNFAILERQGLKV